MRNVLRPSERWIGWASLLVSCLAGCMAAPEEARLLESKGAAAPSSVKRRAEVRIAANAQGRFVAEGFLNGYPVRFLLDTGATDVGIPATLAPYLALEDAGLPEPVYTANGLITGQRTYIQRLVLGDIVLHQVRGVLVPELSGRTVLLGMSALKQLEFIQRDGILILRQRISEPHE